MTSITNDATNMTPDAVAAAGDVLADLLELGDHTAATHDWPVDGGDSTLSVSVTGAADGWLFLAINETVAERLAADPSRLRAGFERALGALGAATGLTLELGEFEPTEATPTAIVQILDGSQMCALFGATLTTAGNPSNQAPGSSGDRAEIGAVVDAAGPAAFEPAALSATGVATPSSGPLSLLHDVDMEVTVELGRTTMPIRELLALQPGMVVEIDRAAGSPIDVLVNGRLIACGEVVVFDEEFGIRITEIVEPGGRLG